MKLSLIWWLELLSPKLLGYEANFPPRRNMILATKLNPARNVSLELGLHRLTSNSIWNLMAGCGNTKPTKNSIFEDVCENKRQYGVDNCSGLCFVMLSCLVTLAMVCHAMPHPSSVSVSRMKGQCPRHPCHSCQTMRNIFNYTQCVFNILIR